MKFFEEVRLAREILASHYGREWEWIAFKEGRRLGTLSYVAWVDTSWFEYAPRFEIGVHPSRLMEDGIVYTPAHHPSIVAGPCIVSRSDPDRVVVRHLCAAPPSAAIDSFVVRALLRSSLFRVLVAACR